MARLFLTTLCLLVMLPAAATAQGGDAAPWWVGTWSLVQGDCEPHEGRSDWRAQEIRFWESVCAIEAVRYLADGEALLILSCGGEGEIWADEAVVQVSEDGQRMTRTFDEGAFEAVYHRCDP